MADSTNAYQNETLGNGKDLMSEAAAKVKAEIEEIVESFDLQQIANRVEDFGKRNPLGLAASALALGVAAGFLMRNQKGSRLNNS